VRSAELRIGNLVDYEATTHIISALSKTYVRSYWAKGLRSDNYTCRYEEIKPIPLSEEWLLKLQKDLKVPKWVKHIHTLQNWYFYKNKCKKELLFK